MNNTAAILSPHQTGVLLRGEANTIAGWIEQRSARRALFYVAVIVVGAGLYGAAMGFWRSPLQSFYGGVKLPLVLLGTALGNGLLNGMLAPLLGLNLGFRQSLMAVLMSFTIAAMILGGLSPLIFFVIWNTPPMTGGLHLSSPQYNHVLLAEVAVIAFSGIVANLRLGQLLKQMSGSKDIAWKILLAWLAGNLFLGAQMSWMLRPFVSLPDSPVEFLRPHPLEGNFYEAIFVSLKYLFHS